MAFAGISPAELEKMHKNFIVACGGKNIKLTDTGAVNSYVSGSFKLNKNKINTYGNSCVVE